VQSDLIGEGAEEMLSNKRSSRFGHLDILSSISGVLPRADQARSIN